MLIQFFITLNHRSLLCAWLGKNRHLQKSLPSKIIATYKMHIPLHIYILCIHSINMHLGFFMYQALLLVLGL